MVVVVELITSQSRLGSPLLLGGYLVIRPDTVCELVEWASVCRAAKMTETRRMSTL